MKAFIDDLQVALSGVLPGVEAQYRMAHGSRRNKLGVPLNARKAGVLALFYPRADEWHLVFIERVRNAKDRHSGQISFPGGGYDETDGNLARTALRETEEEIGVSAQQIELIGSLSELYIPVSNYLVHPYVGFMEKAPSFTPEVAEVASIVQTPFRTFLNDDNVIEGTLKVNPNFTLKDVPFYQVEDKVIWGATAMMMSELVSVVKRESILLP